MNKSLLLSVVVLAGCHQAKVPPGLPVIVAVVPTTKTVFPGDSAPFIATVSSAADASVTWAVSEGASCGTVASDGTFTAAYKGGTCHIVATSKQDSTKSATATVTVAPTCDWTQFGGSSSHRGAACTPGQAMHSVLAQVVMDPMVTAAVADAGDLLTHYQAPLLVGDDVYVEVKSGTYTPACAPQPCTDAPGRWNSENWSEQYYHWESGQLVQKWSYWSDWKPAPEAIAVWEPVFQAAVFGDSLYVQGANGTVIKVARATGTATASFNPFTTANANAYSGPITVDALGNVFYNVVQFDPDNPSTADSAGAWLVKVASNGSVSKVDYATLVPEAPAAAANTCIVPLVSCDIASAPCTTLPFTQLDYDNSKSVCGSQRPTVNLVVAIDKGVVFTASKAHFNSDYSYVIAVNVADLTLKWDASLRGHLADGCGVYESRNTTAAQDVTRLSACPSTLTPGYLHETAAAPAGELSDVSTSSPVALPDGSVILGAYTGYNDVMGHLFKFDSQGQYESAFAFGWDTSPAVYVHDNTYSIVEKDSHYGPGPYDIIELDAQLRPEWAYQSIDTDVCVRDANATVVCGPEDLQTERRPEHLNGFEWCVNAPAVDPHGTVFANSEDGFIFAINDGGSKRDSMFLQQALGAAYTPVSIDYQGRIYALNSGVLTVIGK